MPDNDFWIGQEQIPVDLSLLLTYHNDEDYWYAPEAPAASLASEARDAKAARTELDSQSETKDAPTRAEKADGSL